MTSDYKPISCAAYDEIEILAMRRTPVMIDLRAEDGAVHRLEGRVVDTSIHDGAEFLVLQQEQQRKELRLDQIGHIEVLNTQ